MPLPFLVGAAIAVGSALVGAGGAAVYKESKHKKRVAELQDKIYRLQTELEETQARERKLLTKMNELQQQVQEQQQIVARLEQQMQGYQEERASLTEQIRKNDSRFRKLIAAITFRLNALEEENQRLKSGVTSVDAQIVEQEAQLGKGRGKVVNLEDFRNKTRQQLNSAQYDIESLQHQISMVEMEL